ncbi:protein JINGUBANG-like [Diospyros lotus]|uniref:protein JINGUBANG-like n=1 Tax=Diospyros lotus TaxID=55363 RepID=UPI002251E1F5|nr:protein JINGUBANG-like [Diospyros lotus]
MSKSHHHTTSSSSSSPSSSEYILQSNSTHFDDHQDTSFSSTETTSSSFPTAVSFRCLSSLRIPTSPISCLAVHRNSLYAASTNEINVFDLTTYALIERFSCKEPGSGSVKSIAFAGGKIFTAHQDRKIRVWQLMPSKRHSLVSTLPTFKDRLRHCLLPRSYVQVRRHKKQLWVEHADAVSGLAATEGFLYSVSWDKSFKIWKTSDLRCLESVKAHDDAVNAVAAAPGGAVYTASADGKIKVWERGALMATLEKHRSTVNALALSSDGSALFSGGSDREILAWERDPISDSSNVHNHMLVKWSLAGHRGPILCLIYADDLLFSGSSDRTVRIWRRSSNEGGYRCLAVLEWHSSPVKSLAAVSGGVSNGLVSICSGSLDGEVRLWHIDRSQT